MLRLPRTILWRVCWRVKCKRCWLRMAFRSCFWRFYDTLPRVCVMTDYEYTKRPSLGVLCCPCDLELLPPLVTGAVVLHLSHLPFLNGSVRHHSRVSDFVPASRHIDLTPVPGKSNCVSCLLESNRLNIGAVLLGSECSSDLDMARIPSYDTCYAMLCGSADGKKLPGIHEPPLP